VYSGISKPKKLETVAALTSLTAAICWWKPKPSIRGNQQPWCHQCVTLLLQTRGITCKADYCFYTFFYSANTTAT